MPALAEEIEKYRSFFKSRKGVQSIEYAREILKFLIDVKKDRNLKDWVRARDLKERFVDSGKIPYSSLFAQLSNLEEYGLVEKQEKIEMNARSKEDKQKPSVYYKAAVSSEPPMTIELDDPFVHRYYELTAAKALLKKYGCSNPDVEIDEWIRQHS